MVYASKHGSTRQIAEALGKHLTEKGFHTRIDPAQAARDDVSAVDLVVVGGALYSGRWHRDARRFLRRHRDELARVPVAVFGSGPRTDENGAWKHSRRQLDRALAHFPWLSPIAIAVFGGADPVSTRRPEGGRDVRDWTAVDDWAASLPDLATARADALTRPGAGTTTRRRYRPQRWHRVENRLMRVPVRWGLVPSTAQLTTVGRRTGQLRTTMVTVVEIDGRSWLVAPYGEVGWVHNARAAGRVTLTRRGTASDFTVHEVEPAQAGPVLKEYVRIARVTRPYFDAPPDAPAADFAAEAALHPVFELRPVA